MTTILTEATKKLKKAGKASYQYLRFYSVESRAIGLIMGMQRSGTGMLLEAFDNDWRCKVFGEDSELTLGSSTRKRMKLRWKPYTQVAQILAQQKAPLLIAKPLVESQCAEAILEDLVEAKIIWSYRHYQDVAMSCRDKWGLDIIRLNLLPIVEDRVDWFAEGVSDETREVVKTYYNERRSQLDLWCLCWYVRNDIVLHYKNLPVQMAYYDQLAQEPANEMRRLYDFLDYPYPGDHIVRHIHTKSVRRGNNIEISDEIRILCDSMLSRLMALAA